MRHEHDYGVAILLDCRYAPQRSGSVFPHLPAYLRKPGMLRQVQTPEEAAAMLPAFFARCEAAAAAAAAATAAAGAVKVESGVKREESG
jgi:Rad3-related DNA helicase